MINKFKKSLEKKESIKATVLMYGENEFFDEEIFILGDNPLVCIQRKELKYLKPVNYIGKEVEYIPIKIDEEKNIVVGKIVNILENYEYPVKSKEDIKPGVRLEGVIRDLFPTGCFIPVLPEKDALCYFSQSINKNIDIDEGSRVIFTINKNLNGKYRGKVVEVLG